MDTPVISCHALEQSIGAAIAALVKSQSDRIFLITRASIEADKTNDSQEKIDKAIEDAVIAAQAELDKIEADAELRDANGKSDIDRKILIERQNIPPDCDSQMKTWENVRKKNAIEQQKHNTAVQAAFPKRFLSEPESFIDWARARAKLVTVKRVQGIL